VDFPGAAPDREQAADSGADVVSHLAEIQAAVNQAAERADRSPDGVRILLATKTVSPDRIRHAFAAGYRLIGENRVQELLAKFDPLAGQPHETHFIGHLQPNKINALVGRVDCIQTVDSPALAARLQRRLERLDSRLEVMLQVNVSGEASKSGVSPPEAARLFEDMAPFDRLTVRGLMTIGLNSPDRDAVRSGYAALRRLRDELRMRRPGSSDLVELSMGMSGDFAEAIAEGATMVRLGSAVFGART
jgi:pyridoxal phosphate enzyme (YggS family)